MKTHILTLSNGDWYRVSTLDEIVKLLAVYNNTYHPVTLTSFKSLELC